MATIHKVPKRINAQPHFMFGLDGLQSLIIVATIIIMGLFASRMKTFTGTLLFWLGIIIICFTQFVLFRLANVSSKSVIIHTLQYLYLKMMRPGRHTGRGADEAWGRGK